MIFIWHVELWKMILIFAQAPQVLQLLLFRLESKKLKSTSMDFFDSVSTFLPPFCVWPYPVRTRFLSAARRKRPLVSRCLTIRDTGDCCNAQRTLRLPALTPTENHNAPVWRDSSLSVDSVWSFPASLDDTGLLEYALYHDLPYTLSIDWTGSTAHYRWARGCLTL